MKTTQIQHISAKKKEGLSQVKDVDLERFNKTMRKGEWMRIEEVEDGEMRKIYKDSAKDLSIALSGIVCYGGAMYLGNWYAVALAVGMSMTGVVGRFYQPVLMQGIGLCCVMLYCVSFYIPDLQGLAYCGLPVCLSCM